MILLATNYNDEVYNVFTQNLKWCNEINIATAFLTNGGYDIVSEEILTFTKKGGRIRLIVDVTSGYTDYNSILEFATLTGDCKCKIFHSEKGVFHPKFYIFRQNDKCRVLLGSSNLTNGGLRKNIEANLLLNNSPEYINVLHDINQYFDELWNHPNALPVEENDELMEEYRKNTQVLTALRKKVMLSIKRKPPHPITEEKDVVSVQNNMLTPYILGSICGKGVIDYKKRLIKLRIINNVGKERVIRGLNIDLDAEESHKYASQYIESVFHEFAELFKEIPDIESQVLIKNQRISTTIEIGFEKGSKCLAFIKTNLKGKTNNKNYRVPKYVFSSDNNTIRSFLRGYVDVSSLLSVGTKLFGTGKYRIYINVYGRNLPLFKDLVDLLEKLEIKNRPHDRHLTADYDKREMQIRVFPEDFVDVGYNVSWRKKILYDFIRANRLKSTKSTTSTDNSVNHVQNKSS